MNLQPLGPKPNALPSWATSRLIDGAPKRSRTPNLLIRSQMLYPIELWALNEHYSHSLRIHIIFNDYLRWWLQLESNQRHQDFQSCALPTELWSQNKWRFVRDLNPWSLAWQASVITTTPTNHGCGSRIWTNNLWVMSPASYQIAPSRDIINGGGKGIRTPAPISRPPGFQDRSLQPDLGIPP